MKIKDVIGKEVAKKGLCKDCKHFQKFEAEYECLPDKDMGKCLSGKILYERDVTEYTDNVLVYGDSEEYWAYHRVGENFGCVHFEERENVD